MAEILLSFFAVIGLMFLVIYICDYFFYRKYNQRLTLAIDARKMSIEQCIDTFELINSVRQTTSGKAAIASILVIVENENNENIKIVREYMRIFHIPGEIQIKPYSSNDNPFS